MAEMHTPYSSLKKLLFFLNGLVAMSGVLLIGLGTWVNGGPTLTRVLGLSSAYLLHIGYLCLAMGCITVLLGFAGWYGATKENRGILLFCFLTLVVIVLMEITVATVILAFFPIVQDMAFEHILMTLRKNYRGYNEPDDYPQNVWLLKLELVENSYYGSVSDTGPEEMDKRPITKHCCRGEGCVSVLDPPDLNPQGCFLKLMRITRIQSFTLSGGSLGAVAIKKHDDREYALSTQLISLA
uniref:Tetraspanin 16 n=1 Tax=Loxodonta africana TaxID=9785 RepID=G3U3Z1_LOXAF